MPRSPRAADTAGTPVSAEEQRRLEALAPLIATHFRRAHGDMPSTLRTSFEADGLGNRHGAVLAQVLAAGSISVSDLARRLGISLTNASQLAGELNRAGWLRRHNDPDDNRRTLLSLPDDRRDDVATFINRRSDALLRAMSRLGAEERRGFLAGLQAWAEEIDR
ncbi:MarR family winged helix-turn-helix transcriptional regulator [Nocardia sp. CA-151230]|uniref:MarR family winged helix-turn-helix transcriptional regulator n=1 Tax=Nocardia sp. CA-151230 TaxID=3239982 RepID=UPI003D93D175